MRTHTVSRFPCLPSLGLVLLTASLPAQIVNPADKQRPPQQPEPATTPQDQTQQPTGEGKPVVVEGKRVSGLREEDRVGSYGQPYWTEHRRFTETRVYVRDEGTVDFEFWLQPEFKDGEQVVTKQYEFEFGLPERFQLDLYLVSHKDYADGPEQFDEQKFEVRWAFADWGKIWGNPTAYLEWASKSDAADSIEGKLLLGDELAEGWHWGTNLVFEAETGGELERNYEITAGISKTLVDSKFSVGAEIKAAMADVESDRGNFANEVLIGPSVQFLPLPNAHIDFAALAGVTDDSPDAKLTFVFGWAF